MLDLSFSEFPDANNSGSLEGFDSSLLSSSMTDVNGTYMIPIFDSRLISLEVGKEKNSTS